MKTTMATRIPATAQWEFREPGIVDRISSLPDEIISHILTYLPTKYAVGTVSLSRRWKDLWTGVSDLDFDNRLIHDDPLESGRIEAKRRDMEFSRFADMVLSQHRNLNSVRRFRFMFSVNYYNCELSLDFLRTKMNFASDKSQLEEIDIRLDRDCPIELWSHPTTLFTLKNLKVLKLDSVRLAFVPSSVSLSSLKILQLFGVRTKDCESINRLITGCHVLETLHLKDCFCNYRFEKEGILIASVPSLKSLTINNYNETLRCAIEIEAPSLEHLRLQKFGKLQFMGRSSSPLPCLHSAWVDIRFVTRYDREHQYDADGPSWIRLLTQISNAKEMQLSWQILSRLTVGNDNLPVWPLLPVFHNLTHLTLKPTIGSLSDCTKLARSSRVLHSLLNSASKLQHLVIDMGNGVEWEESKELARTPECMLSSLEEIKIKHLKADEDERKMVAYLLKAGAVLKKMNIHLSAGAKYDIDNIEHRLELASLLKLPRGSRACEAHLFLPNGKEIHIDSDMVDDDDGDDDAKDTRDEIMLDAETSGKVGLDGRSL